MFSRKITNSVLAGAVAIAVAGGSYGIVSANSGTGSGTTSSSVASGSGAGGGSNARSGPAAGGAAGTVGSVSGSGFTISTSAGQKVTIDEASSTAYQKDDMNAGPPQLSAR